MSKKKNIPDNVNNFMLANGGGSPCIISKEMSKRIAEYEGIPYPAGNGISKERRREIDTDIIASLPRQYAEEALRTKNSIYEDLGEPTLSNDILPTKTSEGDEAMCMDAYELPDVAFTKTSEINEFLRTRKFNKVDFSCCDLSKVEYDEELCNLQHVNELIFGNSEVSRGFVQALGHSQELSGLKRVSMCGCDHRTSRMIITTVLYRNEEVQFVFKDGELDYRLVTNEDGATEVQIIRRKPIHSTKKATGKPMVSNKWAFVPYGVSAVTEKTFESRDELVGIVLPDSVTSIGDNAFKGCKNLQYVNIPSSIRTLGSGVFAGCYNLKRLYIPNSVETSGSLFNRSSRVSTLRIPMKLVYNAGLDSAEIVNLIIGVNDEDRLSKLDLSTLEPAYLNIDEWPNVIFEERGISQLPFDEIVSIDGMIIGLETIEDENGYEDEYTTLFTLPKQVIAIPNVVGRLGKNSVALRTLPLYIPSSVKSIDEEAFCDMPKYCLPWLVTPTINYENLKTILPASLRNIRIITI